MPTPNEWLTQFLSRRALVKPDARALYAYKCTHDEYYALQSVLRSQNPSKDKRAAAPAIFAIYAAEWWRRNYQGGPWKWEPLLDVPLVAGPPCLVELLGAGDGVAVADAVRLVKVDPA